MASSSSSLSLKSQSLSLFFPSHPRYSSKKPYSIPLSNKNSIFNPLYNSNSLSFSVASRITATKMSAKVAPLAVKSSLIDPDGGALVELVVPEAERAARRAEAAAMPGVRISRVDLEWVHVVSEGWASPLRGFMREDEYLQCLHFNCLKMSDGSVVNMSVPIVLALGDEDKEAIGGNADVALIGSAGDFVAILRRCV